MSEERYEFASEFDAKFGIRQVRVVNRMSWLELMLAVAVGVVVGGIATAFVAAAFL